MRPNEEPGSAKPPVGENKRWISLDIFRGATVAAMLLVNNPGSWTSVYPPLRHAEWNGWTPTDMVFPFFLWIVGVSLTLSFQRREARGEARADLVRHVVKRSAIIFGLGLFLAAFPFGLWPGHDFVVSKIRIPGVLQRIAVCYAVASAIVLSTGWRVQVVWTVGLLVGYAALLLFVPAPGFEAGRLTPEGNLAWWIDSHLLAGHTWSGAPVRGFDPEGILSTLPAVATTLLGALAGAVFRNSWSPQMKVKMLFVMGVALLLAGVLANEWLPINKNLWTSSYALFMAGAASVIMSLLYVVVDLYGWRRWGTAFSILGANALLIYVISGLSARLLGLISWIAPDGSRIALKGFLYQHLFVPLASPPAASLGFALAFLAVHLGIAWIFLRRRSVNRRKRR